MMKTRKLMILLAAIAFLPLTASAQSVNPMAYYIDEDGNEQESNSVDNVQAPLRVAFRANPSNMEDHNPSYEWHFWKQSVNDSPTLMFVRYEEDTEYIFNESGTFNVVLKTQLDPDGTELDSMTVLVTIPASFLDFPNAFSPNNDGINDYYGAYGVNDEKSQKHWKSIVEFHAYIFNRWGQKLYEWHDPAGYWDGKYHGKPVKEGVYFVLVNAKGADGKKYNIRKDVNLLRHHSGTERSSSGGEE